MKYILYKSTQLKLFFLQITVNECKYTEKDMKRNTLHVTHGKGAGMIGKESVVSRAWYVSFPTRCSWMLD